MEEAMKRTFWFVGPVAVAMLLVVALGGDAPAGAAGDAARPVFSRALPNVPGKALTAVVVDYAPGAKSVSHRHAGVVFAYVVSGAVRSQLDGGETRVYRAGESFFEDVGTRHTISENASDTEPARLLAVFVADEGARLKTDEP
jgi:quercetin dioxygenase-like cupin family protein